MADAQDPLEAAVPAAQALVQVPPVDVANPQQNPAPLQIQFFFLVTFNLLVRLL